MRRNISIIELIIIIALIAIIAKVASYRKGSPASNPMVGSHASTPIELTMVLLKGCPTGDFYIGKYEVTNKEYCAFDPGHENPGDNLPVVMVSWDDIVSYCKWLSIMTGKKYRLPTKVEWEYACRAGSKTDYYWGENMSGRTHSCPSIGDYAWYYDNSEGKVHPVGQKKPNNWGLHDMAGNVFEWWSNDWNDPYHSDHFVYGGCWMDEGMYCQSKFARGPASAFDAGSIYTGFRVVMSP